MRFQAGKWSAVALAGVVSLAAMPGCAPPPPPPEAVLSGTWLLVPQIQPNPSIENFTLTFDSDGDLTQVSYQIGTQTVTWDNPPAATNVDGSSVYIGITQGISTVAFNGTLNSDNTVATGNLTSTLSAGGITVETDNGPATMTKQ